MPQDALALDPGEELVVTVTFTPPEEETVEEAIGMLVIQTQGGTLLQVALSLEAGCACTNTSQVAPFGALLACGLVLVVLTRRRS